MTGAAARRAGLVELEGDRLADAVEGLLEGKLDARLDVAAPIRDNAAPVTAKIAAVAEADLGEAGTPAAGAAEIPTAEDRAEEVREAAGIAAEVDFLTFER